MPPGEEHTMALLQSIMWGPGNAARAGGAQRQPQDPPALGNTIATLAGASAAPSVAALPAGGHSVGGVHKGGLAWGYLGQKPCITLEVPWWELASDHGPWVGGLVGRPRQHGQGSIWVTVQHGSGLRWEWVPFRAVSAHRLAVSNLRTQVRFWGLGPPQPSQRSTSWVLGGIECPIWPLAAAARLPRPTRACKRVTLTPCMHQSIYVWFNGTERHVRLYDFCFRALRRVRA